MKYFLLISFLFIIAITKITAQVDLPQAIIVPTGSLGEVSEIRKKILEKTLESSLDDYFAIVPKDLFEEAQEKAFEELDYEECTEEQCIVLIKEMLQVENSFQLVLMAEGDDTYISLNWNDLDRKRVQEEICEKCDTKKLRESISLLVTTLVINEQKKLNQILTNQNSSDELINQEVETRKVEKDKLNKNSMLREYQALSFNSSNENYEKFIKKYQNSDFAKEQIIELQSRINKPAKKNIFTRRKEYESILVDNKKIHGCSWFCDDPLKLPKFQGNFHIVKYKRIQVSASDYPWTSTGIVVDDKSKYRIKMFGNGEARSCRSCKNNRNPLGRIRYRLGNSESKFNPRFVNGKSTILNFNNTGDFQITYKDWKKWPPPKENYQGNSGEMIIDIFMYEKQRENDFFNFLKEVKKLNSEDENMRKVNL